MLQANAFGVPGGPGATFAFGAALVVERHFNVLHDRELLDQVVGLEYEAQSGAADGGQGVVVELGHVVAAQVVTARGGPVQTAEQVQHG